MATRSIVPRANGEGAIGSAAKWWGHAYATAANMANFLFSGNDVTPLADNTNSLGSTSLRFKEVRAVTFYGTATEALYADLAENFTIIKSSQLGLLLALLMDLLMPKFVKKIVVKV